MPQAGIDRAAWSNIYSFSNSNRSQFPRKIPSQSHHPKPRTASPGQLDTSSYSYSFISTFREFPKRGSSPFDSVDELLNLERPRS